MDLCSLCAGQSSSSSAELVLHVLTSVSDCADTTVTAAAARAVTVLSYRWQRLTEKELIWKQPKSSPLWWISSLITSVSVQVKSFLSSSKLQKQDVEFSSSSSSVWRCHKKSPLTSLSRASGSAHVTYSDEDYEMQINSFYIILYLQFRFNQRAFRSYTGHTTQFSQSLTQSRCSLCLMLDMLSLVNQYSVALYTNLMSC